MEKSVHRHTWITRITRILHYCEAAGLFNSNESFCPVAAVRSRRAIIRLRWVLRARYIRSERS
jgi:hypothetical protein